MFVYLALCNGQSGLVEVNFHQFLLHFDLFLDFNLGWVLLRLVFQL